MNLDIALLLAQDGITNGAIYALLALALVLAFSVTRVIFIPQGEFVAYGALTLVALQAEGFRNRNPADDCRSLGRVRGTDHRCAQAALATKSVNARVECRLSVAFSRC